MPAPHAFRSALTLLDVGQGRHTLYVTTPKLIVPSYKAIASLILSNIVRSPVCTLGVVPSRNGHSDAHVVRWTWEARKRARGPHGAFK
ncbi:hypothetical protein BD310DRAFT_935006, partial [Dichomitus squalens]